MASARSRSDFLDDGLSRHRRLNPTVRHNARVAKQGKFKDVVVAAGESEVVQGAVEGARVEPDATLTVQGALAGAIQVAGVLVAEGAIAGTVSISPGGVAVLQGAIVAQIQNEGIVAMDNALPEGDGAVANIGSGRSLTFDELPPELRRKLPTMTTETRQTP